MKSGFRPTMVLAGCLCDSDAGHRRDICQWRFRGRNLQQVDPRCELLERLLAHHSNRFSAQWHLLTHISYNASAVGSLARNTLLPTCLTVSTTVRMLLVSTTGTTTIASRYSVG